MSNHKSTQQGSVIAGIVQCRSFMDLSQHAQS